MRLHRPLHLTLVGGLAVALVGAPAGAGVAAYRSDVVSRGVLPTGTLVGGVDVSGMTRAAALATVDAHFAPETTRTATLRVGDREFRTTPNELGVVHGTAAAVDKAFSLARRGNWLTRTWDRLRDESSAPAVTVEVSRPDDDLMAGFLDQVAREVVSAPKDAAVSLAGGFVRFQAAQAGLRLDQAAAAAALRRALADGSTQQVDLETIAPKVPDSTYETVLLVRTGENKLYVYKHGRLDRTYGIATGAPRYPTPTGRYEVTLKRYRPTWVNPWSKWSMNEPAFIRPGPRNPLGTRALNLSAPGIRIHGTPAAKSIGYSVSHGCIRMRMPDVEALYEIVPKGTTVFIVKAGPARLPGSAPPPPSPADAADGG